MQGFRSIAIVSAALLLLGAATVRLSAQSAQEAPAVANRDDLRVTLYGEVRTERETPYVRLYWETRGWSMDLGAFMVMRRTGDAWAEVTPEPIAPAMSADRDLMAQGLSPAEAAIVSERWDSVYAGNRPVVSKEETLVNLRRAGGLGAGDRIFQKNDFAVAIVTGFAAVDHEFPGEGCEYGVFLVTPQGEVASEPLSAWTSVTFGENDDRVLVDGLTARRGSGGVQLDFTYPVQVQREAAVYGFYVYRKRSDGDFVSLTPDPLGAYDTSEGTMHLSFLDESASWGEDYTYAVAPVTMFQRELTRTLTEFDADRWEPLRPVLLDQVVLANNEVDVALRWTLPPEKETRDRIRGYIVERLQGSKFVEASDLLSPVVNAYIDEEPKEMGEVYIYRLVTVDRYDERRASPRKTIYYLGKIKPQQVKSLDAAFLFKDGEPAIRLRWERNYGDKHTDGYRLLSDELEEGNPVLIGGIPVLRVNEYWLPLRTRGGRDMTFGIVAISEYGVESEPTFIRIPVPHTWLPMPQNFSAAFSTQPYGVRLTWDYDAETYGNIQGFRLMHGDEEVATTDTLLAATREFLVENDRFAKGQVQGFSLQAVGNYVDSEQIARASIRLPADPTPEGLEAPEDVTVELSWKDGSAYAKFAWDAQGEEATEVLGYAFWADYAMEGIVQRLASLPLITGDTFTWELPAVEKRKSYTFRIAALDRNGQRGPFAVATLDLPADLAPPSPEGAPGGGTAPAPPQAPDQPAAPKADDEDKQASTSHERGNLAQTPPKDSHAN